MLNASYTRSLCLGVFFGLFVSWFQACYPCQFEFQLNPFASWQVDDWYLADLDSNLSGDKIVESLHMQVVVLRFLKIILEYGAIYILLPVSISCSVCYMEKRGLKTIPYALLKSLVITTFGVFLLCIIIGLLQLVTELGQNPMGSPEWFPVNPGYGALKAPGANGVDDFKRQWEILTLGEKPIWYPEIVFPKYPQGNVQWTRRKTFGVFKGWCEAGVESADSDAEMVSFYQEWATNCGFSVQSLTTYEGRPSFVATKECLTIRYFAHRRVRGMSSAQIQQIPRGRSRWPAR